MGRKDEFTYYDNADIINNNFQYDKSKNYFDSKIPFELININFIF